MTVTRLLFFRNSHTHAHPIRLYPVAVVSAIITTLVLQGAIVNADAAGDFEKVWSVA